MPTEFRIWHAGVNSNLNDPKGDLFDEQAAEAVMKAYKAHGIELAFDIDHLSLDDKHPNYDGRAFGWFGLEVRRDANGGPELWAVNVRWNAPGLEQLGDELRIYFSPAFYADKDGRPTRLVNIALCARPATDGLQPLKAATEKRMSQKTITLALVLAAASTIKTLSADKLVTLAEGDGGGEVAGINIAELATFLGIDINPAEDPAGFVAAIKAKLDEVSGKLSGSAAAPAADAPSGEDVAAMTAVMRLTQAKTSREAQGVVESWRSVVINQAAQLKKLADDSAAIEAAKYHAATVRQVVTGAEFPADAWADEAKTKPAPHILAMSLEALERRALSFEARGQVSRDPLKAKVDTNGLTPREVKLCAEKKIDVAKYAETKRELAARTVRHSAPQGG